MLRLGLSSRLVAVLTLPVSQIFDHTRSYERARIDLSSEQVSFYHSDMGPTNFLFDAEGDSIYAIDFQHTGFLPQSFICYDLQGRRDPLVSKIAVRIKFPESRNVAAMKVASLTLKRYADSVSGKIPRLTRCDTDTFRRLEVICFFRDAIPESS